MCVLDFLVVLGNALLVSYFLLKPIFSILPPLLIIFGYSMRTICLTRLLRLIVIAYQLRHWFVKIPKKVVSKKISFCYAVTEVLLMCHNDISHMLPTMAINPNVYDHLIQLLEFEQLAIQENICNLNLSSPSIISTHHTKIVHQRTMHFLKASVAHLKKQGFLDDNEYQELVEKFEKKLQSKINVPQFLKAKDVLKNILWLQESKIFNKVLKTAVEISWKQNDVIIKAGQVATGVVILTEGILMSHYEPTDEDLEQHRMYGTLPIADYHDYKEMAAKASKFLIPGSSIGLLGVLTGRINNATVAATVEGKGFFIPQVFFLENLNKRTDPTIGFYSTLWKIASYDIAYWLLSESRNYRRKTQQEFYTYMHRSFVPYLCNRKTFVVTELVKDIVLIEGLVADMASKTIYSGPVYIPRGIIYIRLLREQGMPEPILWIVPSRKAVLLNILKYEDFEDL